MKKLFLTLVSILFVVGCQENSITDPVLDDSLRKDQETNTYHQGTIVLERMLTDPYPAMNSYFIINGAIEFEHSLEVLNTVPAVQQYSVSLNLAISAGLTYLCTVCEPPAEETLAGNISSRSNDTVTLTENDKYTIEKSYQIQGREDGMVLVCRFLITTKDVRLDDVFLVLPEIESIEIQS